MTTKNANCPREITLFGPVRAAIIGEWDVFGATQFHAAITEAVAMLHDPDFTSVLVCHSDKKEMRKIPCG